MSESTGSKSSAPLCTRDGPTISAGCTNKAESAVEIVDQIEIIGRWRPATRSGKLRSKRSLCDEESPFS